MSLTDLPLLFWGYALETAAFTLKGHHLNLLRRHRMNCGLARNQSCHFLKVWGCNAYVKKFHPDKLKPKSEKCVFIGYPKKLLLGTPSITDPKARHSLLRMDPF